METQQFSIFDRISDTRIFSALSRFPEGDRQKIKEICDSKAVRIEHDVRYGRIVCTFIPTCAHQLIKDNLHGSGRAIYQCGAATRESYEKLVIKKMRSGADRNELIADFFARQQIEGTRVYRPEDLGQSYQFSQELVRLLPAFLQQLVEKLDVSDICTQLDEYQTLDFIPRAVAEAARQCKRILAKDFLVKHSNEPELRRALKIKRGGTRKRKGFVWTARKKIAFYEKVNGLPKQNDVSVWQFMLNTLIEKAFAQDTASWLKTHPALKAIPEKLVAEAIKTWRKYLLDMRWNEMKRSHRPRAFEFRHALCLLNYPEEFTYSTLETYYSNGKVLVENQNQF